MMILVLLGTAASPALAAPKPLELGYFLPKVRIGAAVAQRLVHCPESGATDPKFETSVIIGSKTVPDPKLVRVNVRMGLLAKRSTELKLRPDGTLEAFNAANEGEAGVVISALIKAGVSFATGGLGTLAVRGEGPPPRLPFDCTIEAKADLQEYARLQDDIRRLESLLASGNASPAIGIELPLRRAALQGVADRLTVTSDKVVEPKFGTAGESDYFEAPKIADFFDLSQPGSEAAFEQYRKRQPGHLGFGVTWAANRALMEELKTSLPFPTGGTPGLIYRRPVPASVEVYPCKATPAVGTSACEKDDSRAGESLTASGAAAFPQLSGYFSIPIGRGGLFGSEEAAAEFDATGAPTLLKYGSDSGAAALAGVIDTARGAYVGLENAPAAAQQAELDELKRRKEIRDLEHELSKPIAD
jgi:hypothetical protein